MTLSFSGNTNQNNVQNQQHRLQLDVPPFCAKRGRSQKKYTQEVGPQYKKYPYLRILLSPIPMNRLF